MTNTILTETSSGSFPILTVGHSNGSADGFVDLLLSAGVGAVADVRSRPGSARAPWSARDALPPLLRSAGIAYVFMGAELGARPDDQSSYRDGSLDFRLRAATAQYASGISRLVDGAGRMRIAAMCAEKDPCTCHRAALVARSLCERGVATGHLMHDGSVLSQDALVDRLADRFGIPASDMFRTREDRRLEAYAEWERRIAWRDPETEGRLRP